MKIFSYIRYFFYLGISWNWRIATIILREEIKGEKKYGIDTTGADELKKLKAGGIDISHATIYMPASYHLLENIFKQIPGSPRKHFIDIGCGKGRALCVAAYSAFTKISGVDFSKEMCDAAERNLSITRKKIPGIIFFIKNENAALYKIPDDADCIFLFNPFDETVMRDVASNIAESMEKKPRQMHIIYANPLYKNLFLEKGFTEIYYSKRLQYFEVSVMVRW